MMSASVLKDIVLLANFQDFNCGISEFLFINITRALLHLSDNIDDVSL